MMAVAAGSSAGLVPRWCRVLLLVGGLAALPPMALADPPGGGTPPPAAAPAPSFAAGAPPPEDFFALPDVSGAVISPDGERLAYIARREVEGKARLCLAIMTLSTRKEDHPASCFDEGRMANVQWVNDQRLVFQARMDFWNHRLAGGGLWAVDRDGSRQRQLISNDWSYSYGITESHALSRVLEANYIFSEVLLDGSDDVLVFRLSFDRRGVVESATPFRLNTRTGHVLNVGEHAPDHAAGWQFDRKGEPRFVSTLYEGVVHHYERSAADGRWNEFAQHPSLSPDAFGIRNMGFDDQVYVVAWQGQDTSGLYTLDPVTHSISKDRLVDVKGFDFRGAVRFDYTQKRTIGVDFVSDAAGTVWTHPAMAAVQKRIDALLPSTTNRIRCLRCIDAPYLLVLVSSDRQPPLTLVYDRAKDALIPIGAEHPGVRPRAMGVRSFERIKARDGLEIPVYVTRPPGAKGPTPAVVLVHGGPWVHGSAWEWDAEPQFLASRGYTVIEPAYRGSTGYGRRLFTAGLRQWGLAMQDDLADAARWAVARGWADPARIAIAGASYGGYATLMGLIHDPALFRAGFEWVGVTDINLMFSLSNINDFSDEVLDYTLPQLIGDPETYKAQFAATSPLKRAAEIHQPLLMAYGGIDRRVPAEHGKAMRDALAGSNPQVEWILYPDEGHGWHDVKTALDFWTRVERFLARALAPAEAAAAVAH